MPSGLLSMSHSAAAIVGTMTIKAIKSVLIIVILQYIIANGHRSIWIDDAYAVTGNHRSHD